ncbi:MAG: beta-N-acetylglucosaminidase domain-containing protein [Atopobiaceae bacterium]|nr:beta-N-acetylglucosaminidase domain-containing protein [Atopobiaceae bacterium]
MGTRTKRLITALMAVCAIAFTVAALPGRAAAEEAPYQIYPTPHDVSYGVGEQTLRSTASTVVEDGIDADTRARLAEALALKGITAAPTEKVPASKATTSILVGVKGSGGPVDAHVKKLAEAGKLSFDESLFEKTDSYLLASLPGDGSGPDEIIVLGRDTDAAFYGLTTLYQIFQQLPGAKLRALTVSDHADVITRGFIEGYYGNPWSTEDRVNLMTWGGYYKLNAYVYAPKDDPKHNAKWRELYTPEELAAKIGPLADAGNRSKCRFLFALHPFMSNPITAANYDETLPILKAKFTQVMDYGVRQIAILADDAGNQGAALYTRLLEDMTEWIHEQQRATNEDGSLKYPGLKDTIVFCPVAYYGQGESWYANLPENIQVVNTGGRVWGKIDNAFATRFSRNSGGRAPFMWINWPCSDNDKDALHMGGHNNFLGADVKPGAVEGVVLNPMQQSEPSKQGIFMNADFSWNLWTSTEHADQVWEDSFSYIDHNGPSATKGSRALRDLSVNMRRMYGGGVTWLNDESPEIAKDLAAFRAKLADGSVTASDADAMIEIFTELRDTARAYRDNAGDANMLAQITYWVDAWDDLTSAALLDLEALKADLAGDSSALIAKYSKGTAKLDEAMGHGYSYVDHIEYARVGKAHITPTVLALNEHVAGRAELAANPDAVLRTFITNRADAPVGSTEALFDGRADTGVSYRDPASLAAGTYFGVEQSRAFDLKRLTVTYDQAHLNDTLRTGKVQVLREVDGERRWTDVAGATVSDSHDRVVDFKGLAEDGVLGVRLIATADNAGACWLTVNEIEINKEDAADAAAPITGTVSVEKQVSADAGRPLQNASDASAATELWLQKSAAGSDRDTTQAGAAVIVTFDAPKTIGSIVFEQGSSNAGDVITAGTAYYRITDGTWHEAGAVSGKTTQTIALAQPVEATAIKVVNNQDRAIWWRVADLHALADQEAPAQRAITTNITSYQGNSISLAHDGNDATKFWSNRGTQTGDWVMLDLGRSTRIDTVRMLQGAGDNIAAADLYYTADASPSAASGSWTKVASLTADAEQTVTFGTVDATAVKFVVTRPFDNWFQLFEFEASEQHPMSDENVRATFDLGGSGLTARVGEGTAATSGATVRIPDAGDVVSVDLGSIRREITVAHDAAPASAELVYSQNGLEWLPAEGGAIERARFVGYRATAPAADVSFQGFTVSFLSSLAPSLVSSDVSGSGKFDVSKVFDGNAGTNSTIAGSPAAGDTIVFDLGQERSISSFDYFVPEGSLDFIRNAVIEVADAPDAPDDAWSEVLDINSEQPVENVFNNDTAKTAPWLTHSAEFPGNMTAGATGLDASGRYLRIRFTGTYSHRWVCLGELRINGGEHVSTYVGGEFESDVAERQGASPDLLLDGKLTTFWQPAGNAGGRLVYHVSAPLKSDGTPYEGVRIISHGAASGAAVKAVVYTDADYEATEEVALGTINQPSQEFRFGEPAGLARAATSFTAVKDVIVSWEAGADPQIAEFYLLGDAAAPSSDEAGALQRALDAARAVDTSAWTRDSQDALKSAVTAAEAGLDDVDGLTAAGASELVAALENAMTNPVPRYVSPELADLVAQAPKSGEGYAAADWQELQQALALATTALDGAENLPQAQGEELAAVLKSAIDGLSFDASTADRAAQAIADTQALYGSGDYTAASRAALDGAVAGLQKLIDEGAAPSGLAEGMRSLDTAVAALVDVSALRAERDEFSETSAAGYTAASYQVYKQAFDDSTPLMRDATAEQVAAAVSKLQQAQAGLEALDIDALIADAEKLSQDDYTAGSWDAFARALAAAKDGRGSAQASALAQTLVDARAGLVNVVALKDAIARAEKVDGAGYAAESLAALADAAAEGANVLVNGTDEQVEAARQAILNALAGLVKVGESGSGGATQQPGSQDDGKQKPASESARDPKQGVPGRGKGGLPKTGDPVLLGVVAVAAASGACMVAAVVRRRK